MYYDCVFTGVVCWCWCRPQSTVWLVVEEPGFLGHRKWYCYLFDERWWRGKGIHTWLTVLDLVAGHHMFVLVLFTEALHYGDSVTIHVGWLIVLQEVARRSVTKTQVDVENGEEEEDDAQMVSSDLTETLVTRLVFLSLFLRPHALGFSMALEWALLLHTGVWFFQINLEIRLFRPENEALINQDVGWGRRSLLSDWGGLSPLPTTKQLTLKMSMWSGGIVAQCHRSIVWGEPW